MVEKLEAMLIMPGSNLAQTLSLQLNDLEGEVGPQPHLVELDLASEPVHLDQLHVVDQGVAVLPRLLSRASEGPSENHLNTGWKKAPYKFFSSSFTAPGIGRVGEVLSQKAELHRTSALFLSN